ARPRPMSSARTATSMDAHASPTPAIRPTIWAACGSSSTAWRCPPSRAEAGLDDGGNAVHPRLSSRGPAMFRTLALTGALAMLLAGGLLACGPAAAETVTLPGISYEVLGSGPAAGPHPTRADEVTMRYVGR